MLEKYQTEKEKIQNPHVEKGWDPTVKELLSDRENSELFGELLKYNNAPELVSRMSKGELTSSDIDSLDRYRKEYISAMERSDVVIESIDQDTMNEYAKNNEELRKIASLVGPEEYKKIVKDRVKRLSVTDPFVFDELAHKAQNKKDFKEGYYTEFDKELMDLCKKKNIKPEAYMKALAIEDPDERADELRKVVRQGYGMFRKSLDWLSAGGWSKKRVGLLESHKESVDDVTLEMQMYQDGVGQLLAGVVSNKEVMNALSGELVGERQERIEKQSFHEGRNQLPKEDSYKNTWDAFKKTQASQWDTMSDPDKDAVRDSFEKQQRAQYAESRGNKQGFWATVFGALFDAFVTNNRSKLN